jgi:hypothetical protein
MSPLGVPVVGSVSVGGGVTRGLLVAPWTPPVAFGEDVAPRTLPDGVCGASVVPVDVVPVEVVPVDVVPVEVVPVDVVPVEVVPVDVVPVEVVPVDVVPVDELHPLLKIA